VAAPVPQRQGVDRLSRIEVGTAPTEGQLAATDGYDVGAVCDVAPDNIDGYD
jgi:hypothetical protein